MSLAVSHRTTPIPTTPRIVKPATQGDIDKSPNEKIPILDATRNTLKAVGHCIPRLSFHWNVLDPEESASCRRLNSEALVGQLVHVWLWRSSKVQNTRARGMDIGGPARITISSDSESTVAIHLSLSNPEGTTDGHLHSPLETHMCQIRGAAKSDSSRCVIPFSLDPRRYR